MRGSRACVAALIVGALLGGAAGMARAGDGDGAQQQQPKKSIDDLIRDLGSDDFKTREAATDALGERGAEAIPALTTAAQDKDPEVRWRAEKALKTAREKAGAPAPGTAPAVPEQGRQAAPPSGPRDPTDEAMRELERSMQGGVGDLLKGLRREDLPKEFAQAFDEMEKNLREMERGGPGQQGPQGFRDFWTFKFKDGQWQVARGDETPVQKIGLRTQPLPPVARAQLVLTDDAIVVEEVKPGSTAERAGLQRYDIVFSVDGRPTRTDEDLAALARPGDHEIGIMRAGKRDTLRVAVAADGPPAPAPAHEAKPDEGKVRKY